MRTRRYVQAAKATALSAAVILFSLAGVGPAGATHLKCGSVITTDTTLTHDIIGCKNAVALSIGADNVTLNLGGFVLGGLVTTHQTRGVSTNGHSGVVVKNGIVRGFSYGVWVGGPFSNLDAGGINNRVERVTAKANVTNIYLRGTSNTVVSESKMLNGTGSGLRLIEGGNNSILNNRIHNNSRYGVQNDFASGHLIEGNTITNNGSYGIITIPSMTIRNNNISHNGHVGIYQYPHGQTFRSALTIAGNLICNNTRGGIVMTAEGHTITDNNVGIGTPDCLRNGPASGYDLYDEVAASLPVWDFDVCPSTWRNNYTDGDTFNHPCVTK